MTPDLHALLLRCNRIGVLFDSIDEDSIRSGDAAALAHAKMILAEFNKSFDAFLAAARQ
jgi:hypothetical protein